MTHTGILKTRFLLGALAMGACLAGGATVRAQSSDSIEARYSADVARCNRGDTNQDKATCLQEAGAARDEARRNRLANPGQNYEQNQTDRCNSLPASQREACLTQMSGANTTTQGSVMGGGVLRETTIDVPPGTPGSTLHVPDTSSGAPAQTAPAQPMTTPATPAQPATTMPPPTQAPGTGVTQ